MPVIVYNHQNIEGVIESALHLQNKLETEAKILEENGGKYIRPIVLFQAQPKGKEDNTTFDKLKAQLIAVGIPEEQIKIKTANKDELKNEDLMNKDCPVRYIITINALKEGWDCPFAYILASLADKSSEVDVTQILGRVLRQPYVMKHNSTMLNLSYVITASVKFQNTLQNIIKGLQQSGFSEKDYREKDFMTETTKEEAKQETLDNFFFPEQIEIVEEDVIDVQKINFNPNQTIISPNIAVSEMERMAIEDSLKMEIQIANQDNSNTVQQIYSEVGMKVKQYKMRESVAEQASAIVLPKFVVEVPQNEFLLMEQGDTQLLDRVNLLKDFKLSDKDIQIPFKSISSDLYKIDTEKTNDGGYKMVSFKIENVVQEKMTEYILAKPKEGQIKDLAHFVLKQIDKLPPIADNEIKKYVNRILENMSAQELIDFNQYKLTYSNSIKEKINQLADIYAEEKFNDWLEILKIKTEPNWKFETAIILTRIGKDIGNSLYVHEGDMNGLEEQFILEISSSSNIAFWHRNLGRGKGFALNGFKSNHYPDFILVTKTNKVIVVETKGSQLNNPDTAAKLRLGKSWARLSNLIIII